MSKDLIFSLQTISAGSAGTKALTPDADGFYRGVPVAAIGIPSRNNVLYDAPAFVASMNNKGSLFYKSITEGNLEGEWGHPILPKDPEKAIERLLTVDRSNVSHYFSKVYTKEVAGGITIVYADVKPCGPMGQYLHESFQDKHRDTAFSLRSATGEPYKVDKNIVGKKIMALCTFDAVGTPGYAQASKRFAIGTESFIIDETDSYKVSVEQALENECLVKAVGFEHITSQQTLDIFGVDKLTIKTEKIIQGVFDPKLKQVITKDGPVSLFHNLYH